jgi:hypothetical protein
MKIPKDLKDREDFYNDLVQKCLVSREERRNDYAIMRSYYLFGCSPNEPPALFNKINPHLEQVASFLYSSETTRFSINLGATAPEGEAQKIPALTHGINDRWLDSNADIVFGTALTWSLAFNSTFVKLVNRNKQILPYMVDPGSVGVLREDMPVTDRQEAFVHTYYMTKSDLYDRLYSHPHRQRIIDEITASEKTEQAIPTGVDRIIMSQVNPAIYGNVNMNLEGYSRYRATVAEPVVEMRELWVWNDETMDYQVVTQAEPEVVIYDREGEKLFLKGELPFIQLCPDPLYDYYWGASEVHKLVLLQDARNKRVLEIMDLLSKQVNPPTALMGFTGLLDEKNFTLNRAGGLLATDMPTAKVERLAPNIPEDVFREIEQIDRMFEEASGINSILAGRGESGVRSANQASQLARLGSSRIKKRALIIEDALEKMATLYLKLMQRYDDAKFRDEAGLSFIAEQFTKDFTVKVDAHSNSPVFMEDLRQMAFNLRKVDAIDNEDLLELLDIPGKQLLKAKLKKREAAKAAMPQQPPPKKGKPDLQEVK